MFGPDRGVIVFTADPGEMQRRGVDAVAEVVACGSGGRAVDVGEVVADLRGRGLGRILCEGGPSLSRTLFGAGLVDEMCLTLSPMLAGTGHHQLSEAWVGEPRRFELVALMEGDGMLLTRYTVVGR
jgi:riboflavin biosynthesis pyrimidine reductase